MKWKCPKDWKHVPENQPASDGMLMGLICRDKNWHQNRSIRFRRCNASGKTIWPFQKAWFGVVAINHHETPDGRKGSYAAVAWLNEDQYVLQKLKGNI